MKKIACLLVGLFLSIAAFTAEYGEVFINGYTYFTFESKQAFLDNFQQVCEENISGEYLMTKIPKARTILNNLKPMKTFYEEFGDLIGDVGNNGQNIFDYNPNTEYAITIQQTTDSTFFIAVVYFPEKQFIEDNAYFSLYLYDSAFSGYTDELLNMFRRHKNRL